MNSTGTSTVEGIDESPTTEWLEANVGLKPPVTFELVAGGRSNLTFRVTDRLGEAVVLRRPPTSHVLPTAHDMQREHRIISALGPTPVPVPRTLAALPRHHRDRARPFYRDGVREWPRAP